MNCCKSRLLPTPQPRRGTSRMRGRFRLMDGIGTTPGIRKPFADGQKSFGGSAKNGIGCPPRCFRNLSRRESHQAKSRFLRMFNSQDLPKLLRHRNGFSSPCGGGTLLWRLFRQPDRGSRQSAVRVGFVDSHQEIRAAAQWARKLLESSRHSGGSEPVIGIVVPELSKHRSSIERLFSEEFHPGGRLSPDKDSRRVFNISLGPAFSEYPLIQAALQIFRVNPDAAIAFDDVTLLLRSPFLARAQTDSSCLCGARSSIAPPARTGIDGLGDFRGCASGLKSALLVGSGNIRRRRRGSCPAIGRPHFPAELKSIGWPGERPLNSTEYQTTVAWNDLLSEFAALDAATGSLSRGIAVSISSTGFRSAVSAGIGNRACSDSRCVRSLGNEFRSSLGYWPARWRMAAGRHSNPFLPLRLQRSCNIPHSSPQRELEFTTSYRNNCWPAHPMLS